ncbi:MAG TPA: class B sortase [Candidatus Gemmiger excrementavium]|uniref:Class B sortase n=1 Tax=Candidatus Gemmiger excrementavium TaxID=2838608 RepID=A0A9D2JGQ2_9FIRM|nr:class B sortase [Candidatus Gemmiger excrementavium]
MKRFLLFFGAFAVGMAAALAAAGLMLLPGWLKARELQSQRPTAVAASTVAEPTPAPAATPRPLMDFTDLLAQNEDVVGWIAIDGTPIDFPVLQGTDNDYYLRHGLDGEYDIEGIPYVDFECDVENGRHLIIYGHNMGVGETSRFSSLQNYKDPEYYTQHPVIEFDTLYESTLYKVVGVVALTSRTDDEDYYAFNEYADFADDAAEQQYLDDMAARAFYTTGDFIHSDERLLSLCFCTYEMEDARMLVLARPLREGEEPTADSVTVNPDPILPARWPTTG